MPEHISISSFGVSNTEFVIIRMKYSNISYLFSGNLKSSFDSYFFTKLILSVSHISAYWIANSMLEAQPAAGREEMHVTVRINLSNCAG